MKLIQMISLRSMTSFKRGLFYFSNFKKNHYEILQSTPSSSQEELKSKYYSLVKKYHPDVSKVNQDHIKALNEAYSILSDEAARKKYDLEQGFINKKKIDLEQPNPNEQNSREQTYKPYRPYYDQQRQMFKSKLRRRPGSAYQMLFQNFIIGMLMTGVLLFIFGLPSQQRRSNQAIPQRKISRQQFQQEFQASLMRKQSYQ